MTANNSTVSEADLSDVLPQQVADGIDLYLPPVLFAIGTTCNIFVIMVMRSKYFRSVSTALYLTANAVSDFSSVLINLPTHWLYVNFPEVYVRGPNSHYICKVLIFFGWGTSDFGVLLTAAMTVERALAVTFPLRAGQWCTIKRAKITTFILVIVVTLKDSLFLIKGDMVPATQTDRLCSVDDSDPAFAYYWTKIFPWLSKVYLGVCFTLIIVCNIVILKNIRNSDKIQSQLTQRSRTSQTRNSHNGSSKKNRTSKKGRSLTVILLVDSFTVMLFTLPFNVYTTMIEHMSLFNDTKEHIGLSNLVFSIVFYLLYVNRCANFFLYCMSGSRFRKALRATVCCCRNHATELGSSGNSFSVQSQPRNNSQLESSKHTNGSIMSRSSNGSVSSGRGQGEVYRIADASL